MQGSTADKCIDCKLRATFSIAHQKPQLTANDVLEHHHSRQTSWTAVIGDAAETSLLKLKGPVLAAFLNQVYVFVRPKI